MLYARVGIPRTCADILQLRQVLDLLPENIMTLIFHVYCSQELYQATDDTYQVLTELDSMFPTSAFLKTQRALLFYHSKGLSNPPWKIGETVTDLCRLRIRV